MNTTAQLLDNGLAIGFVVNLVLGIATNFAGIHVWRGILAVTGAMLGFGFTLGFVSASSGSVEAALLYAGVGALFGGAMLAACKPLGTFVYAGISYFSVTMLAVQGLMELQARQAAPGWNWIEALLRPHTQLDSGWMVIAGVLALAFALVSANSGRSGIIAAASTGGSIAVSGSVMALLELGGVRISHEAVWTLVGTLLLAVMGGAAQSSSSSETAPAVSTPPFQPVGEKESLRQEIQSLRREIEEGRAAESGTSAAGVIFSLVWIGCMIYAAHWFFAGGGAGQAGRFMILNAIFR
jgi:hypothetical protein